MAEVTGRIGSDEVELNNAATEATLRLLLQSTLTANKQSIDNIKNLAQKSGLDPTAVAATNKGMANAAQSSGKFHTIIEGAGVAAGMFSSALKESANLAEKLASGAGQASDVFGALSKLPFGLGLIATGFQKLALAQESYLNTYRQISAAGVNFGGSLTEMRLAASATYMTLEQFSGVITRNSQALASMGGNATDGARAFTTISNSLLKSGAGDQLRSLGYTSQQVNEGLLTYISMTGGRTKAELANSESLKKSTAEYLTQLDGLAQLTGRSREEQQKALDEEVREASFQAFLSTKTKEEREAIIASMKAAEGLYGKAGMDIVKAASMGVTVQGGAGQKLTALGNGVEENIRKDLEIRQKYGNDRKRLDANEAEGRARFGVAVRDLAGPVGTFGGALKGMEVAVQNAASANAAGLKTEQDFANERKTVSQNQINQTKSEADSAAKREKTMNELGQTILDKVIMPIQKLLLPILEKFVAGLVATVDWLIKTPGAFAGLGVALAGLTAAMIGHRISILNQKRLEAAAEALKPDGSVKKPYYVIDMGEGFKPGSGPEGGGAGGKGGKGGKLLRGLKGFGAGAVAGIGFDLLADALGTDTVGGASADLAGSAASGAGTGALLGSIIPGIGTAIGGVVGGVAGGAYGLYKNWGTLFGSSGSKTPTPTLSPTTPASATAGPAAGSVSPTQDPIESLIKTIDLLNKQTTTVVYYLKETAENTKRTYEATRNLDGNLFPRP